MSTLAEPTGCSAVARRVSLAALGMVATLALTECRSPAPAPTAAAPPSASSSPHAGGTRLILLGTKGGPRVGPPAGRKNPSTLIMVNGVPYVVDCGYGTSMQLVGAGVALSSVHHVFVTHHHSDHMLELGPVVYNGWVTGSSTPVNVYGPPGTSKALAGFLDYMQLDLDTRRADEGRPDLRALVTTHEFDGPGVVLQNQDVKVLAERVAHPPITHAYALRFETKDRVIVISGDTAYSSGLARFAQGADVLVHEVLNPAGVETLLKRVPNAQALRKHLFDSHTLPEDVGKVAAEAGVRTLVLSHLVPGDDSALTDDSFTAGVAKHFHGPIIVGKDLLEIPP